MNIAHNASANTLQALIVITYMYSVMLILLRVILLIGASTALKYSSDEAHISVLLSCQAFCDPATFMTREWYNETAGFNATLSITDRKYDSTGYVGYLPSEDAIYVVYSGTISTKNDIADAEFRMVNYTSFPGDCEGCKVHRGFYHAMLADMDDIEEAVKQLLVDNPTARVKTSGHSLGAALSQLAAMELIARGVDVYATYNFGQPRTGNAAYAAFCTPKMPLFREVHYRDLVPHIPPSRLGYTHICSEVYDTAEMWASDAQLDHHCGGGNTAVGHLGTCEDDGHTCMGQWRDVQLNSEDHMTYLGVHIGCYNP